MKNKKVLFILIPATLTVWGIIIYKIVANMHPDDNIVFSKPLSIVNNGEVTVDSFSINPTYRDPFLGKVQNQPVVLEQQPIHKTPSPTIKVSTPWPALAYHGIIKNTKLKKEMVLLEINGQEHMMKLGESVDGVLLSKAFKDSVEVQFAKEKKIIHK